MALFEEYVNRSDFSSYEDMKENLRMKISISRMTLWTN